MLQAAAREVMDAMLATVEASINMRQVSTWWLSHTAITRLCLNMRWPRTIDASDLQGSREDLAADVAGSDGQDSEEGGYLGDDEVKMFRACDHMMQHGMYSQLCLMLLASRELPGLHMAVYVSAPRSVQ